ncbi:23S rRNA G2069 N7-methylase RlmK or C1962 C5-methylase RlmI [Fibrobacter sp. UWB16]|uniref:class I SAM-dependent rRNA methyltransferase n=1 Tax=Fibrobacter sp. UWB16 TaxID=1945874 RepID=UPI000BDCBD38|nr:class I SAM-dependent methyltransferase [Fibrobacter sp. UWB16]SOD13712.1 23S rRNA G2069 N7-methylase RlmK or C1962 C5-methylase RlmI [Fibrobacter sp. UWB16]
MNYKYSDLLKSALSKRAPLFDVTDALRIVNGAADGFPGLTIDKFGDRYQMQFFGPELLTSKTEIVEALASLFNPVCVVSKERLSSSGKSLENAPMDVVIGTREDAVGTVREGNANFHVDLLDTINPGLFLDMRHVRLEVEERFRAMSGASPANFEASAHLADLANLENSAQTGLRFLNLFSYTCSFSVHARLGGAAVATNADISGKILDKGRENYALNGLDLRPGEFFRGNAIEYVHWAQKKGLRFDGIVLDPPSFARFKGFNFNVREHLMPLVADCATLLNPGGFFMVSSNYSEFNLSAFARDVLAAVSSVHPNAKTSWKKSQDVDFVGSGSTKDSCLVATLVEV